MKISAYLQQLSKGVLPDNEITFDTSDELSEMADNLNTFSQGLKQTTEFATAIGGGNLDTEFKPLSDSDILGNSLLEMRSNLYKSQLEDEKRQHEDDQSDRPADSRKNHFRLIHSKLLNI